MKFTMGIAIGLFLGVLAGIAAVVAYAVQSDQDVREVFAKAQKDIESIDLEAVGAQVQASVAEAQTRVEEGMAQVKAMTGSPSENGAEDTDTASETVAIASA
jgi:hypothetical protein